MDFCNNIVQKQPMTARITQILEKHRRLVAWLLVTENNTLVSTGTCFLLTESLGLTCYHVLKDIWRTRGYSIVIGLDCNDTNTEQCFLPAEVAAYSERYDYAFLRVTSSYPRCPGGGLLPYLALPPQDGAVAIIRHPQRKCKQRDFCSVIDLHNHEDSSHRSFVHVLMYNFLETLDAKLLTYITCLHDRASGAPVFNEGGELVAMNIGVYMVETSDTAESVIEYGRSIVEIIVMGSVEIDDLRNQFMKLVERNETLQRYMSSEHPAPHMKGVITRVKILWDADKAQINTGERDTKKKHSTKTEVEAPDITQRMIVQDYPMNESEDNKEDIKRVRPPVTVELTISNEDALHKVLELCNKFISPKDFLPGRPLSTEPSAMEVYGCYKCESEKCKVCDHMMEGAEFYSYNPSKKYNICQTIKCNSTCVVYLISCTSCQLQYVGYTEGELKERIRRHMSDVLNANAKTTSTVSRHFQNLHKGIYRISSSKEYGWSQNPIYKKI